MTDWKVLILNWILKYISKMIDKPATVPSTQTIDTKEKSYHRPVYKPQHMKTIVLSFGHGSIDPSTGEYHCIAAGKQYTFRDGYTAYEGQINRLYQEPLASILRDAGYHVEVISHDYLDIDLDTRVDMAADVPSPKILICLHHNASPRHNANGWEIWTSRRRNNSDILAEHIWFEHFLLKRTFPSLRMRSDVVSDGDHDFEAGFKEIVAFDGPAVYIENGFFDHRQDLARVTDPEYIKQACAAIARAIQKYDSQLY